MKQQHTTLSRRSFIGSAAAFTTAAVLARQVAVIADERPNSNFGGVQIGVITYSYRALPCSAEEF